MQSSGNLDVLIERAKKKAEAEAIVTRARQAAERDLQRARAEWQARREAAEARVAQALEARRRAALAEIAIQERRAIMAHQEWAVNEVFAAALARLRVVDDPQGRRALLLQLVEEAVTILGVLSVRMRLNEADRNLAVAPGFPDTIGGARVVLDEEILTVAGGPVISDVSGRLVYDNSFEARQARQREGLRAAVAALLGLRGAEGRE